MAARTLLERRKIRKDLLAWCKHALKKRGQLPARHHRLIIEKLQDIEDGKIDRLLILAPPGSAKSTYTSMLFPAHYLARFPDHMVIAASHNASLATRWGRQVRGMVAEHGVTLGLSLDPTKRAGDEWVVMGNEATMAGEYYATGVLGSVTGRRADLAVLDDLVKGRKEADSETVRESIWDWYKSDLYTRLKPNGKIVLIMTHWHEDDPAGRLLRDMKEGGDQWEVLRLPALADSPDDPLGRLEGEALWPEWEDKTRLLRKKRVVGEREWSALYMQQPRSAEGTIILAKWWKKWATYAPRAEFIIVSLDTAYTEKEENDRSACTVWYVLNQDDQFRQKVLLRYAWAEHLQFHDLVNRVRETCEEFGQPRVPMRVLIEAKASGLSVIQELRRRFPDMNIWAITPQGDKVARAYAVQTLFENGSIYAMAREEIVREADPGSPNRAPVSEIKEAVFRPWAQELINECASFPLGRYKDQVDSTTQALRHIRESGIEMFAEDEPSPPNPAETERREPLF